MNAMVMQTPAASARLNFARHFLTEAASAETVDEAFILNFMQMPPLVDLHLKCIPKTAMDGAPPRQEIID